MSTTLPTVQINDVSLDQLTYKDVPVVTFQQIAEVHGVSVSNVHKSFSHNKEKFTEGKHFYLVDTEVVGLESNGTRKTMYLFTQQGYLFLTKPIKTPTRGLPALAGRGIVGGAAPAQFPLREVHIPLA
jgi:hypothetical protein